MEVTVEDSSYDEEVSSAKRPISNWSTENPCWICWHYGHRAAQHDLPSHWSRTLKGRWEANAAAWKLVQASAERRIAVDKIAAMLDVDTSKWDLSSMESKSILAAIAETHSLRELGLRRWAEGTDPTSPPPTHMRQSPPMDRARKKPLPQDHPMDIDKTEKQVHQTPEPPETPKKDLTRPSSSESHALRTTNERPGSSSSSTMVQSVSRVEFQEAKGKVAALAVDVRLLKREMKDINSTVCSLKEH